MIAALIAIGMITLLGGIITAGCWSALHLGKAPIVRDHTGRYYRNMSRPAGAMGLSTHSMDADLAKPSWCMYCDEIVETRYMRWDFAKYGCMKCVEGKAIPELWATGTFANQQVKPLSQAQAALQEHGVVAEPKDDHERLRELYDEYRQLVKRLEGKDEMVRRMQEIHRPADMVQIASRRDGMTEIRVWQERVPLRRDPVVGQGISHPRQVRKALP